MLQRLRISTKLAILVAIPLVSLVLLGLVAAQTLQQVRIGGKAYSEIGQRKDIISDVNPPHLYLVEADLGAAGVDSSRTVVDGLLSEGREHAERRALEDEQRKRIGKLDAPIYELPRLPDGIDLGGLYELAAELCEQGMA